MFGERGSWPGRQQPHIMLEDGGHRVQWHEHVCEEDNSDSHEDSRLSWRAQEDADRTVII